MRKWLLVFGLLILAIIVAFSIFAFTGVIDAPALFWNIGMKIGFIEPHLKTYAIGRDTENWIAIQTEELQLRMIELEEQESALATEHLRLEQRAQQLDNRETTIALSAAKLGEEQELKKNIETLAALYIEMNAAEAAKIIEKLDKQLILNVLLNMETQDAASILVELPTNLAISLSEELGKASQ